MSQYLKNISDGVRTVLHGMRLTLRHMVNARSRRLPGDVRSKDFFAKPTGMVTIQYPQESIPVPDHGRYKLHNEMDDCIVCDKCAKVCPVDCIEIEPIKATGEVGKASDGSSIRLYAEKFDIDMAKCCYCGLCTTVCPTECLTMTKSFDTSVFDIRDMVYEFGNLSAEQAQEKRALWEQFTKEKEAMKAEKSPEPVSASSAPRPVFRPAMKPSLTDSEKDKPTPKPVFRPSIKPVPSDKNKTENDEPKANESKPGTPKFHPASWSEYQLPKGERPRLKFDPTAKKPKETKDESPEQANPQKPVAGLVFRPTQKPAKASPIPDMEKPKPAFRPTMKPKK